MMLHQLLHESSPHLHINHAANSECRHDPANASRRADSPVLPHGSPPVSQTRHGRLPGVGPVVQVQAHQVHRRAKQLHRGRDDELGDRLPARMPLDGLAKLLREHGAQ